MRRSSRWRTLKTALAWVASSAILVGILLELAGVFSDRIAPAEAAIAPPPPKGPSALVEQVEEPVVERYPGTVRAVRRAVVSARILATVRDVLVNPGDRVEAGQTLIALDARDLIAREQQARGALRAAEAELERASADYRRKQALVEDGSVSRSVFDAAEAAYRAASAQVELARRQLEEAQVALTYAEIKAPFGAVVSERYVDPGDQAAPGVALLKLYDPERLRLEAHVRASRAVRLERGEKVSVWIDALEMKLEGQVDEIVPQAESGSRSLLVKVAPAASTPACSGGCCWSPAGAPAC